MSEPRKTILFVDDEANILAGLGRMLRGLRQSMDLQFAASGEQALAVLAAQPVDVLVTDMRMPGMDGATLLGIVQERYPQVVRLMLSGQSDRESVLRTVGSVHQFLTKPTTQEALKEVLRFFFEEVGVNRVDSRHDPNNPHSGMVMAHCGMTREGTVRQGDRNNQGICDYTLYGILKSDYFA